MASSSRAALEALKEVKPQAELETENMRLALEAGYNCLSEVFYHLRLSSAVMLKKAATCRGSKGMLEPGHAAVSANMAIAAWCALQGLQAMERRAPSLLPSTMMSADLPGDVKALMAARYFFVDEEGYGEHVQAASLLSCSVCGLSVVDSGQVHDCPGGGQLESRVGPEEVPGPTRRFHPFSLKVAEAALTTSAVRAGRLTADQHNMPWGVKPLVGGERDGGSAIASFDKWSCGRAQGDSSCESPPASAPSSGSVEESVPSLMGDAVEPEPALVYPNLPHFQGGFEAYGELYDFRNMPSMAAYVRDKAVYHFQQIIGNDLAFKQCWDAFQHSQRFMEASHLLAQGHYSFVQAPKTGAN